MSLADDVEAVCLVGFCDQVQGLLEDGGDRVSNWHLKESIFKREGEGGGVGGSHCWCVYCANIAKAPGVATISIEFVLGK